MLEKFYTKSSSGRGTFDKPWNVREYAAVELTKRGFERRKRIGADLGLRPRECIKKGGLPRIRQANETRVRDNLKV